MYYKFIPTSLEEADEIANVYYTTEYQKRMIDSYVRSSPVSITLLLYRIKNDWGYDEITYAKFIEICEDVLDTMDWYMSDRIHDALGEQLL